MSLLSILYWVVLVLAALGFFVLQATYPRIGISAELILFILIGLKSFRTPLQ